LTEILIIYIATLRAYQEIGLSLEIWWFGAFRIWLKPIPELPNITGFSSWVREAVCFPVEMHFAANSLSMLNGVRPERGQRFRRLDSRRSLPGPQWTHRNHFSRIRALLTFITEKDLLAK